MEHHDDVVLPPEEITLPASWHRLPVIAGGAGVVLLVLSVVLGLGQKEQFAFSYLIAFTYWLTLALGGLFFVLLHYLSRAGWSVVVRRLAENAMRTLPMFAVLFIPIAFSLHGLYHWTHAEAVASDPLLAHKTPYLNQGFFFARAVFYFAVWSALAFFFWRQSTRQDQTGDLAITARLQKWSALGMVLFAVTLNFAAFDWLMSLEPHWFSTIFGVYVFAGTVVSIFSLLSVLVVMLCRGGRLRGVITVEHLHDLGKLLFGFVVFWAYIGFSQFMLIWYANIPEETFWYDMRWNDPGWRNLSIFLAVGHFVLPFFYLISQPIKRRGATLMIGAVWMLLMHYVDLYWLVMPTHHPTFHPSLLDVTCWLGVGGVFVAYLAHLMRQSALVPKEDPRLAESLAAHSV